MRTRGVLEIACNSAASAFAAAAGGADRLELCSDLAAGGTTPPAGMLAVVRRRVQVPIHVLVRPRAGDFVYDAEAVALIQSLGAQLVDMETYVYIWVAQRFDIPIRVLKAVSDDAQDGATTGWDEAVAACSRALYERIRADYGV